MSLEDQGGVFHRLLLSPLNLLHDILGTVIPGGIFLLLLAFKGNAVVRSAWVHLPFGYNTNLAIAIVISYAVGKTLQLATFPFWLKKDAEAPQNLKHLPNESRQMLFGALTEGVFSALPILTDKMAVLHADSAFHAGMALCLIVAGCFPGDGKLRIVEILLGILFLTAGTIKMRLYQDALLRYAGAGLATVIARSSKDQLTLAAAIFRGLGLSGLTVPIGDQSPPPPSSSDSSSASPPPHEPKV